MNDNKFKIKLLRFFMESQNITAKELRKTIWAFVLALILLMSTWHLIDAIKILLTK